MSGHAEANTSSTILSPQRFSGISYDWRNQALTLKTAFCRVNE
jgi:hypothetical protein